MKKRDECRLDRILRADAEETRRSAREQESAWWRFLYRLKDWTDEWEFSMNVNARIEIDDREDDR